jgi:hypothetical protein
MNTKLLSRIMKVYITALYLITISLLYSCKKEITIDLSFPLEKIIVSDSINVAPVIYASNPNLLIAGDYLVLIENKAEKIFSLFKIPECTYTGGFGVIGRGPNEFNQINPYSVSGTHNSVKIFDYEKGLIEVDFKNFPEEPTINQILEFPDILKYLNSAFEINDSIICGIPYPQVEMKNGKPEYQISNKPYIRYNANSKEVDYFGNYPKLYPKKYSDKFWLIYMNLSAVKPDRLNFVSVGYNIKSLSIYNNMGKLTKEVIMKAPDNLFLNQSINPEILIFYDAVKVTDKYIYAICENSKHDNLLNNIPYLEIWDWSGNPIALIKFDRSVAAFEVTKDDKKIYFIDRQSRDKIFRVDLTGFLK